MSLSYQEKLTINDERITVMADPTPNNPSGAEVPPRRGGNPVAGTQPYDASADRAQRTAARQKVAEAVAEEAKKRDEEITAQYAADHPAGAKPTPTPHEIAMAAGGMNVMEKEDDGSGPDLADRLHGRYLTRESQAKVRESERERRGR
jgi:hypothetical protein